MAKPRRPSCGKKLSSPELQLRAGDRFRVRARDPDSAGRKGAAQRTGWVPATPLTKGQSPQQTGSAARRPALRTAVRPLRFRLFAATLSGTDQSVLRMRPAGSTPRQVFTFISPARSFDCRGGQGQLGAGPQPGKVPWSGLVPSSSHQPWSVRPAEDSSAVPRGFLAVSSRGALIPWGRRDRGDRGRDGD